MTDLSTERDDPTIAGAQPDATPRRSSTASAILSSPFAEGSWTFFGFLVLLAGYVIWLGGVFANSAARLLDVHQNVPILMLSLAVLVTLIAGQFDLSVASVATLTTFLTIGLTSDSGLPIGVVIVICLLVGGLAGLVNGLVVEVLGVNAFIATLGTGAVVLAASAVYSDNQIMTPSLDDPLPTWFSSFGSFGAKVPAWLVALLLLAGLYLGITSALRSRPDSIPTRTWRVVVGVVVVVALLALFVVMRLPNWIGSVSWATFVLILIGFALWLILQRTTSGRYLQAAGSNPTAARLAGVDVRRQVIKAFVLGGVIAGGSGVVLAASQGSASPGVASSFLLPAFAAAFLSTVVFSSGRFSVWGALTGGFMVTEIGQGLVVGGIDATWTGVVNGVVLILAVALSTFRRRRR